MARRKRISTGYLVYSTNSTQQSCIRALVIVERYETLSYKRVNREVVGVKEHKFI